MPQSADIVYTLTTYTGSDGVTSLGGTATSTVVPGTLHGLFHYVSPETAGGTDTPNLQTVYRAIDVKNLTGTDTLYAAVAYIDTATTSTSTAVSIALDSSTQAIANEYTAPSGGTLSAWYTEAVATSKATGLLLGDMAPGAVKRIWLRRIVTPTATKLTPDAGQLTVTGGTAS